MVPFMYIFMTRQKFLGRIKKLWYFQIKSIDKAQRDSKIEDNKIKFRQYSGLGRSDQGI
jgi:hypothetical protein